MNAAANIPVAEPDLRGNEAAYLARCIEDNWVSSAGPFVGDMERRVAEITGTAHGVATVNGTAGLHLALLAAGVGPGDRVVVPDWTFAATANAVFHAGAEPFFVDITDAGWTLDAAVLRRILQQPEHRVGAVITVHALGHPAEMAPLAAICRDAGIALIEDAAGALGASYEGKPVGGFGDFAVFSFNGNKTVTAGGGGMIVTDDGAAAKRMRRLSAQARATSAYRHDEVAFNYRMTNLNAAVGLAQLERLDDMLAAKRALAAIYDQALAGRADLSPMPRLDWARSSNWLYALLCPTADAADGLVAHLAARAIDSSIFWLSLSAQAAYADCPRQLTGVSRGISGRVVVLPSSSSLSPGDQARVVAALAEWRASAGEK
ncbi:MAG TPA: aminotransferase class I/II-fold pyridoxal phosphate-dependent enzyme [Alphaproteobacteria bacterium]|nr:aminotransferase class I/II-fold pyridoxal phosphate-dependent enzyme [Alphaproteobacteria bacterium]HJN61882.1 aminotransferase class I/II-fold pyridoxal phosphate-dependent enzyme [Alphaproteobacteria bacterium]